MSVDYPTATMEARPWGRWLFLLALVLACLFCAALLWLRGEQGQLVTVAFREAHGLEVHDPVRFRGLDVGSVRSIRLAAARDHVEVELALAADYADLAATGTRFWIAHPRLDWERVSGLDTVIGTRYVGCLPGTGETQLRFVGLEDEPLPEPPGALAVRFHASQRDGLHRGAPIVYRGLIIGRLTTVGLSSDARWVEAEGYVEAAYRHLVFVDSRFCPAPGLRLDAGITGVSLELPALAQLGTGGLVLINKPEPGEGAEPGQRFQLAGRDLLEEAGAQGAVVVGRQHAGLPPVVAISLRWTVARSLWWDGSGRRDGLGVPFRDGLLVPMSFLSPPAGGSNAGLLVADQTTALPDDLPGSDGLMVLGGLSGLPSGPASWRSPDAPEDLFVRLADGRVLPVPASSLLVGEQAWHLPEDFPGHLIAPGSPVLAASDGAFIGLVDDRPWRVLTVPADR